MSNEAPTHAPARTERLSAGTIARYGIGSLGTGGFATLPGLVLTYFLTDHLGITAAVAGIVITVSKLWDVIIDPIIGALTDRELTSTGSRRRMMMLGGIALPVFFTLTFAAGPELGPVVGATWVLIAFTLTATAFSMFQVPYIALPAELTGRYDERTRLLTWRVMVLTIAILLFGAGGPMLRKDLGYLPMGIIAGVVIGLGMVLSSRVAPVGVPTATPAGAKLNVFAHYATGVRALRRSQPFRVLLATFVLQALATGLMLAGAQYVATWVMRSEDAVTFLFVALIAPALLAAPLWNLLSRRVDKTRAFRIATGLFMVAAFMITAALWAPGDWLYLPVGIAGIAYAGMQSLPMAMLPDVITADETATGTAQAGAFGGVWTAGETIGFTLGATTLTIILTITGYVSSTADQSVTQPTAAVSGIVLAFSLVPALLAALSLWPLARYRVTKQDIDAASGAAA